MKKLEFKFIRELFLEEFPFKTRSEKDRQDQNILYVMNNNSKEYLKWQAEIQGGSPEDYQVINCGWHDSDSSTPRILLLNYNFTDYESRIWTPRGSHWPTFARIFDDVISLRKRVVSWLGELEQTTNHLRDNMLIDDIFQSLARSELSKIDLYALLEIEELLSKSSYDKNYPSGGIHYYIISYLERIIDYKTGKSDLVRKITSDLGLNKVDYDQYFNPQILTEEQLDEFIELNDSKINLSEISNLMKLYSQCLGEHELALRKLSDEFFSKLSNYLNPNDFNYSDEIDMCQDDWINLSKDFSYKDTLHLVKVRGEIISIKEKSQEPLRLLIQQYKRQDNADYLVTKEELLSASKYKPENIREFKVGKSLFPKEPLKSLVQYDKHRGGYLLAV